MSVKSRKLLVAGIACMAGMGVLPALCTAAIISGSVDTNPTASANLSDFGSLDWAYWNTGANPAPSGSPTNGKAGGSMIGSLAPLGGGNLRGSTSTTQPATLFSFTGGTSPVSGGPAQFTGLFNTGLDTAGRGASLAVELPTLAERTVYLWVANYNSNGQLTASLPGADPYTDASGMYGSEGGLKGMTLYTLDVAPDTPGDILTLDYVMPADGGGGNSHVAIVAAAVAVPEPSTLVLAVMGAVLLLGVRRRRRS